MAADVLAMQGAINNSLRIWVIYLSNFEKKTITQETSSHDIDLIHAITRS